jgi:putative ABC transport system permease protein
MTLLISAITLGLILSLLALGVYISFRIFHFPDITTEGSITFGAAISAVLLLKGLHPVLATMAGFMGGALSGMLTGVLHTKFKFHGLLSGILVMTALYSINLHTMGKSNVPLLSARTLPTVAEGISKRIMGGRDHLNVFGWEVTNQDFSGLFACLIFVAIVAFALYFFFRTNLGTAMRATGDNPQMICALGTNVDLMIILGLGLSNGLVALSGALLAQYQGFADVQMGIGMVVWGLASVIIGEALVGTESLGLLITGAIMGSILFRLLVAIALRWGLNPNDLKLITALFVFAALILPNLMRGKFSKMFKK